MIVAVQSLCPSSSQNLKQPDVKVVELGTDLAGGSKIEIYMIRLNKSNVYYLYLELSKVLLYMAEKKETKENNHFMGSLATGYRDQQYNSTIILGRITLLGLGKRKKILIYFVSSRQIGGGRVVGHVHCDQSADADSAQGGWWGPSDLSGGAPCGHWKPADPAVSGSPVWVAKHLVLRPVLKSFSGVIHWKYISIS